MKFTELPLKGAYLIELSLHCDERGYFARTFCEKTFKEHNLMTNIAQCSTSFNHHKGLIRGMHYQCSPFEETKLVRCTQGSIFDVMVDIRPSSETYGQWYGTKLSRENGKMFYIPKGFAHGYQVLEDNSEVFYMMDEYYSPDHARSLEDGFVIIEWPLEQK